MLNQISWGSYFEFVAILIVIYYSLIFFVFYRKGLSNRLPLKFQTVQSSENEMDSEHSESIAYLRDETKAFIHQAGYSRSAKEEILFGLQKLISSERFESVDRSIWKDRINNFIKIGRASCRERV